MFRGNINKTQWTVIEAKLGMRIEVNCATLVGLESLLIFASLRDTAENFFWCSSLVSSADLC